MTPALQNTEAPREQPPIQTATPPLPAQTDSGTSNLPRMVGVSQTQNSYSYWANFPTTLDTTTTTTTTNTTATTITSTTTGTATSVEEKDSAVIQLRNRPPIDILPPEMKFHIFDRLGDDTNRQTGLIAFGKTSTEQRLAVIDYFHHSKEGIAYGKRIAAANAKIWNEAARQLSQNTHSLRSTFDISATVIEGMHKSGKSDREIAAAVSVLPAVQLDFRKPVSASLVTAILQTTNNKPVKINAYGIWRDRLIAEVLPALRQINPGCPVILNAAKTALTTEELQLLVDFMKKNPCIYRLDLSENSLGAGEKILMPMVELFKLNGPLTHLYLKSNSINTRTALLIAKELANHPCLTHVDLQLNSIRFAGKLAIIKAVGSIDENGVTHTNLALKTVRLRDFIFNDANNTKELVSAAELANSLALTGGTDIHVITSQKQRYVVQIKEIDSSLLEFEGMKSNYHALFDQIASDKEL